MSDLTARLRDPRSVAGIIVAVLTLLGAGSIAASSTAPSSTASEAVVTATFTTGPLPIHPPVVTEANFGDSITAGYPPMNSWTVYVISHQIQIDTGAFQVGLRSDQITDSAIARGIPNVKVMVIMGCTNDIAQGIDWHACLTNWDRLAAAAPNVKVIVAAIAPSNVPDWAAATLEYNAALRVHATAMGWLWVDPYEAVRAADGSFLPGFQRDPVNDPTHPNNAAQQIAAAVLTPAILTAGRATRG